MQPWKTSKCNILRFKSLSLVYPRLFARLLARHRAQTDLWHAACSAQVDVNIPVETAYELWRDKKQIIKWMPWINRIEMVPDHPNQSKWVLSTDQFGRHWELSWRALDLTPIKNQKVQTRLASIHVQCAVD